MGESIENKVGSSRCYKGVDAAGVRYSQAGGNMRFGFHLYNDEADVDTTLNAITDTATS